MGLPRLRLCLLLVPTGLGACFDPTDPAMAETGSTSGTASSGGEAGSGGSTGVGTSSETGDGSSSSAGESTAGTPACEAPNGQSDPLCESPTPLCWDGDCVGCEALADGCAVIDANAPICGEQGACVPCVEHEQCESAACVLTTGACVGPENRLWVDAAADCDAGVGTEGAPFCAIGPAAEAVNSQPGADAWAIFVAGAAVPYAETLTWSSEHPLALLGPGQGIAAEVDGGEGSAIRAIGGGQLFLSHLVVGGAQMSPLIECFYAGGDTRLWADDVTAVGGSTPFMVDCDAVFRRSLFEGGPDPKLVEGSLVLEDSTVALGGGLNVSGTLLARRNVLLGALDVVGGSLTLESSFVRPEDFPEPVSIQATGGAAVDILYSTITSGFACDGGGPSAIRNSIVVNLSCPSAQVDHSGVDSGVMQGEGNVLVTEPMLVDIVVSSTDLHVRPDAPLVLDLAVWDDGDPEFDIDGDPRPNEAGAMDVAGADVP